ncbi:phage tail tube protein [Leptospira jelokensis]|uniref:Phage tail protein n=1 Tax=Leptospira jelokensis TaxID=2484931 RepID=A0A4Z1A283_9LEPT|nr:phage tail tube protein [Leptospira jelokensis]TGL58619.1 hypothetical protein EHQ62_17135 [Leptospira jelokensis]
MPTNLPPNPDILTGNDALIKINGQTVGFMTSLNVTINNNVQPIKALGFRKPRGLKSLDWSGQANGEFHILRSKVDGVVDINTNDDTRADDLYSILVIDKSSGKRVGQLIGAVQTEGFNLMNNQFTSRSVSFELMDWEPMEAYN